MPHLFYYLDYTVSVFVVFTGKVLLVRHRQLQKWLPLGGHIEPGENPEQAAHREVEEESGLKVELLGNRPPREFPGTTILTAPSYLDVHDIHGEHRHLGMIYFARSNSAEIRLAPEEHHEIRWFSAAELADPAWGVPEAIQFYSSEALRQVGSGEPAKFDGEL